MQDVTRSFPSSGGAVHVLRGVRLEVRPGEFVMITGPSGSGKTTLLNLAALMDSPSSGEVFFGGRAVSSMDEAHLCRLRRERVGMVFQRFCLLPRRSALDNVLFRFRYTARPAGEAKASAEDALATVGLGHAATRPGMKLSAGEMQRVAIARAVALRPELLVADEPTGNLDAASAHGVMECFRRLNGDGLTILLVTHNEALLEYATRHMVCRDGVVE